MAFTSSAKPELDRASTPHSAPSDYPRICDPDALAEDVRRAADAKAGSPYLFAPDVADFVGLSIRGLENMRYRGGGPRFYKQGRYVRYHIDDVLDWCRANAREPVGPRPAGRRRRG